MFSGGKILITGGTGSFGNAVLQRMLNSTPQSPDLVGTKRSKMI